VCVAGSHYGTPSRAAQSVQVEGRPAEVVWTSCPSRTHHQLEPVGGEQQQCAASVAQTKRGAMPEYSEREYWEQRYRAAGAAGGGAAPFDWYMDYAALKPALTALVPSLRASSRVLVLGCGTSPLGEQLYDDGFQQLTLVDFADGCVRAVRRALQRCRGG
jgi:hypothetical protein